LDSAPYVSAASNKSEVKLLTLSKDEYEEVKDRFPDARDILNTNVRSLVSLAKDGNNLYPQADNLKWLWCEEVVRII